MNWNLSIGDVVVHSVDRATFFSSADEHNNMIGILVDIRDARDYDPDSGETSYYKMHTFVDVCTGLPYEYGMHMIMPIADFREFCHRTWVMYGNSEELRKKIQYDREHFDRLECSNLGKSMAIANAIIKYARTFREIYSKFERPFSASICQALDFNTNAIAERVANICNIADINQFPVMSESERLAMIDKKRKEDDAAKAAEPDD